MNRCGEIDRKILLWESEGVLPENDLDSIRLHLNECGTCQRKYGSLFPLISGEVRSENPFNSRKTEVSNNLTASIMKNISKSVPLRNRPNFRLLFPAVAAAAVFILLFSINLLNRTPPADPDTVIVEFRLAAPSVNSVTLVGDFNNWEEDGIALTDDDQDGIWTAVVTLKRGNLYKYNFIIDNEIWIADPESEITLDDGFGGKSSVIHI